MIDAVEELGVLVESKPPQWHAVWQCWATSLMYRGLSSYRMQCCRGATMCESWPYISDLLEVSGVPWLHFTAYGLYVTFTINPVKIFIQVFQWRTLHHHTFPYRLCGKASPIQARWWSISGMDPRSLRRKVDIELFIL
jgi:hypothetical protein